MCKSKVEMIENRGTLSMKKDVDTSFQKNVEYMVLENYVTIVEALVILQENARQKEKVKAKVKEEKAWKKEKEKVLMKKARKAKERAKVFKIKERGKEKRRSMEVAGRVEEPISVKIVPGEKQMVATRL